MLPPLPKAADSAPATLQFPPATFFQFENPATVKAEAVNIINSRPLSRISDSDLDEQPITITPNHLLHLHPTPSLPPGLFDKEDLHCRRVWRQAQCIRRVFWRRWTNEYLPTLMERQMENAKGESHGGIIVLLADENYPRGEWPIARVLEAVVSDDDCVRVVKVKTASTVATHVKRRRRGEMKASTVKLTRPVTSLCCMEMDDGEEFVCAMFQFFVASKLDYWSAVRLVCK